MGRTVTFRVIHNRMQFRCSACGFRRNTPVQANIRRKNIRCHKCGAITKCMLNRRALARELQSGKVVMITNEGKEMDVNLYDVSMDGVGFDIPLRAARARSVTVGQEVRFRCSWNPRLFGDARFVVKNNNGQRIGAKKIV